MSKPYNCIICANEFNDDELKDEALLKINSARFKVCNACFGKSDVENDYQDVKDIIDTYLNCLSCKREKKNNQ